jgi:hypothetical protein
MKIKHLLLLAAAASLSATAVAQDITDPNNAKGGEYAETADGAPAMTGQPTNDHFFVRGSYDDPSEWYNPNGEMTQFDNKVSFKGGSPQTVWFWLDDSEIYANPAVTALTPINCDEAGDIPYAEITYNSLQMDLYLPVGFELTSGKNSLGRNARFDWGARMPFESTITTSKRGTVTIDNVEYNSFRVLLTNNNGYGCHLSANDEFEYEDHGALKKDDAPVFALFIKNNNQAEEQGKLADMIVANQELGFREGVAAGWEPNDYKFFYGTGGNNREQRYQVYNRVGLWGSSSVVDNLAEKTVSSVKYVNIAGMVSENPFEGVNIMVTTYNDGTTSTCKVIK